MGSVLAMEPIDCLAKNIYFEARGESLAGMVAVATVTLNRVESRKWPNTICNVVYQPHQFSWTKDGLSDIPNDAAAWAEANYAANIAIDLFRIKNSTHYHNNTVAPKWAFKLEYTSYIGKHLFYK